MKRTRQDEFISAEEICDLTGVDLVRLESVIEELEEAGLIMSSVDNDGQRIYDLTIAGRNLVKSPEWTGKGQPKGTKFNH